MDTLPEIQEKLQEASAAIAKLERAASENPGSYSLGLMRRSLSKRLGNLESAFLEAAENVGVDVCTYRMFRDAGNPRIGPLASALADFQYLISAVVDAVENGPKIRFSPSPDVIERSSFGFGYTYPGSVGFALTIENERLLAVESELDSAVRTVFEMTRMRTTGDVQEYARRFGAAVVRQFYKWVNNHSQDSIGADIDWRRGMIVREAVLVQPAEFMNLKNIIDVTSDETVHHIDVVGELRGADIDTRNFHMKVKGQDIRGRLIEGLELPSTIELPRFYEVRLSIFSRVIYSKDQESKDYYLTSLREYGGTDEGR